MIQGNLCLFLCFRFWCGLRLRDVVDGGGDGCGDNGDNDSDRVGLLLLLVGKQLLT